MFERRYQEYIQVAVVVSDSPDESHNQQVDPDPFHGQKRPDGRRLDSFPLEISLDRIDAACCKYANRLIRSFFSD